MATYDLAYPGAAIDAILNTAYFLQEAGYIFQGSASEYSGTPSKRVWLIAPAGFTGLGLSSAVPQGSFGICLYNGTAWVGKVINVLTLDSEPTRNSQNGVTSGGVAATLDEIAGGIMETFASLLFDDETASADLRTKLSYAVKFSVSDVYQTVTHLNILAATTSKAGLMSAEDKAKVDSFLANLRSLTFTDTTASADQGTKITETLKATIGGVQEVIDSITLLAATSSKAGLLSASDKAYIDALPATLTNLANSISGALALMQSLVGYYVCDTAAGTAAKTVAATGYSLTNGGCIRIKMTNANTANNVTLNINSTGAKALYYDGAQASSTNTWEAGEVLEVYYDGTQYQCASGGGGKFASGEKVGDVNIFDQKDGVLDDAVNIPSSHVLYGGDITLTPNDFEQGSGDPSTGEMVDNTRRIRTKNFIQVVKGCTISFTYNNQPYIIYYYDNNKNFISATNWASVTADIAVESDGYVKFFVKKTNDGVIVPSELADVITISYEGMDDRITKTEEELANMFGTSLDGDFEISDESNNVLARFKNGHIETKNFNSAQIGIETGETLDSNLDIADERNYVIARFSGGHIITKNFNSAQVENTIAKFSGKSIGIIGDSISTFAGWLPSDITGYDGDTYATYYPHSPLTSVDQTWWYKVAMNLGISPLKISNCSWSGSRVTGDATSTTRAYAGCSDRRISDLTARGFTPDIIICFISCNDWANNVQVGTWEISDTIPTGSTLSTLREAYATMLYKINQAYPLSRLFCCTNLDDVQRDQTSGWPSNNQNGVSTQEWNENIIELAHAFGADVIDVHSCGLYFSNIHNYYAVDTGLHPNDAGHTLIANRVISVLKNKY